MSAAITLTGVSCAIESVRILRGLTFSVPRGDLFIVIGPNGSGKTTLMRILAGLLPCTGEVRLLGREIRQMGQKALARHVALVPQQLPADFPFSVREVVLMGRFPHQGVLGIASSTDHEIAEQAMADAGVLALQGRRLNQLSGGELQRAFIARALCQEPDILLLDEPTAFLDLTHQIQVMDLLEKLKEERRMTVVMVSHDINLASLYGDDLLLMRAGRVVQIGPPAAVLNFRTLEDAYGCVLLVDENPLGGVPRVTPVPARFRRQVDACAASEQLDNSGDAS